MAHERVFGICEDKCQVDITEQLGAGISADENGNLAVGTEINTTGKNNTAVGANAHIAAADTMTTMVGARAGQYNNGTRNTGVGYSAIRGIEANGEANTAYRNVGIGTSAGRDLKDAHDCVLIGYSSGEKMQSGTCDVGIGNNSLQNNAGDRNVAIGYYTLQANTTGSSNVAVGSYALACNTTASQNVAIGDWALHDEVSGIANVAIGANALKSNTDGDWNTAIGYMAMGTSTHTGYNRCVAIGAEALVTGDYQVQLGASGTTVYAYSALNNRSDERDKADIHDTALGLEFIEKLRPVSFRWDMREDYKEYVTKEDGSIEVVQHERDGSKKRNRFHEGLIAQEVKAVMDELGVDFAGYQDHKVNGGEDVLTLGYTEFIGPMIKAIQELSAEVKTLKSELAACTR